MGGRNGSMKTTCSSRSAGADKIRAWHCSASRQDGSVRCCSRTAAGSRSEPNTIIFARRGEIFAATIDPDLLDDEPTAGDDTGSGAGADRDPLTLLPRPVLEGVASSGIGSHGLGRARFAAARDGALVFVPPAVTAGENRLVFVDRNGRSEPIDPVSDHHQTPRLSPDGRRVAFSAVTTILQRDLWLLDLDDGTRHRLTDSAGDNHSPLWSRDGRSITFASSRTGLQQVFRLRLSTPGAAEAILHGDSPHARIMVSRRPASRLPRATSGAGP